ncbi:hypothetical protein [Nocardiopsis coralliicola]
MNRSDEHDAGAGGDGADGGRARDAEHGGGGGGKSRINLSAPQVVAGGVATLTAATAASYLGVYGTIAGAAVMSVLSTAGTAVTQHFLEQSQVKAKEKAKEVADRAKTVAAPRGHTQHGGRAGPRDAGQRGAAAAGPAGSGQAADPDATAAFGRGEAGGDVFAQTEAWDPRNDATRAMPAVGADAGDTAPAGGADGATRRLDAAGGGAARGGGLPGADGGPDGGEEQQSFWRRYRMPLIAGAVLFVGVMLVILVFELLTGRSLSDTVQGRDGGSSPSILGGVEQTDQPGSQDSGPDSEPGTGPDGDGGQDGDSTDQPGGGQETADPGGGQDTGEPGGGQETSDPGGGQDTGEPGGDQDTGDPGSGDDGGSNDQPGGGQNQQPDSGQGGGAVLEAPEGGVG